MHYRNCRLLLLTVLSAACIEVVAQQGSTNIQSSSSLTLEDAVSLALAGHPDPRMARGRVAAAEGRARQAGLWANPEFEVSAEDWPTDRGFSQSKRLAGVSQTIPFPGKKRLERQIADKDVRESEWDAGLRRLELEREVKKDFYRALAARRLAEVSAELVRVAEDMAASSGKRVSAGAAADQELLRAEVALDQARSELDARKTELAVALDSLRLWIGRTNLEASALVGTLEALPPLTRIDEGAVDWLTNHPSMKAAELGRERAALAMRRARLEPYPDVKVGLAGGVEAQTGQSIAQISVALPLPIIDRSKGRKMEARAGVDVAEANVAATRQILLRNWNSSVRRHRLAEEQFARCRDVILPKSLEALKLVQAGFEEGKFGFIDLLDTQRTASEARVNYLEKLLELRLAGAELDLFLAARAAGQGQH
jgi:cobalt-zinc-cadmium efflux system outer membrane protein